MKPIILSDIEKQLATHDGRKIPGRRWMVRSAVTMLLVNEDEPSIMLMRRPVKKGDPWSGDMCLPGGRKDPTDKNSFATATRETLEEVGLDLHKQGQYLGRLSDVMTRAHEGRKPMVVTPFVFSIDSAQNLNLSEEAREIISVPIEFLADPNNRQTMNWKVGLATWRLPCYHFNDARIWGLTLMMLDELIRLSGGRIPFGDNWMRFVGLKR